MDLKTKQIRKLFEDLQTQIYKLQSLLTVESINTSEVLIVTTKLCKQQHSLSQRFENLTNDDNCNNDETNVKTTTDTVDNLKPISLLKDIDELVEDVKSDNIDKQIIKQKIELLLNKFMLLLKALEDLECLPLKQRLQDCLDYVKEMSTANEIEDLRNIKELGTSILEIIEPLQNYKRSLVSPYLSEKVALYTSQLSTSFEMLVQLAQEQHQLNAPIFGCKKYICERICTCCEMTLELLSDSNPTLEEETFEKKNHFVYKMDLALDIILDMPSKTCQEQLFECTELWLRLEDVFSYAMAIIQVCEPYNFKAITGSCQCIVMEYEKLKQQLSLEVPDPALNTLFMHTLTDALYRLERKVNIAVLTLAMEVFSNPYAALKKLVMTCGNSLNPKRRSKSDLTNLIEDFDQLSDQIIQIGVFAIACCKNINRNNKIRNCLAGFESLETELVSAITLFYLHPDNKEMRSNVKLLTVQWQLEMNKFNNAVNLIINSAAFCQIILDNLQERITAISNCLDNRQPVTQLQVQGIIEHASALSSQITAIINDIGSENIDRQTIIMIRELKAAIFEANTASKTLLIEDATEPQQLRVIKRCELILNVVQRLQPALSTVMNNQSHEESGRGDATISNLFHDTSTFSHTDLPCNERSLVYIKTPYTVKTYKPQLSIQPANSVVKKPADLSCLIPYIQSGRTLRSEHSIMYNTSQKMKSVTNLDVKSETANRKLSSIRQHLFSRDSFTIPTYNVSEESMDLTTALEKITLLSTSTNATSQSSATPSACHSSKVENIEVDLKTKIKESYTVGKLSKTPNLKAENCFNKCAVMEKIDECTISGGGDASSVMETCQKLNNIRLSSNKTQSLPTKEYKA